MNVFDLFAKLKLDSSDYEKGLGDAKDKASSFGNAVSTGFSMAGKGIDIVSKGVIASAGAMAAATGAVATAVGVLGAESVKSYADYEQLAGGIETLFGTGSKNLEEYAKTVKATARDIEESGIDWDKYAGNKYWSEGAGIQGMLEEMQYNYERLGKDAKAFSEEMQDYLHFEYDLSTEDAEKAINSFLSATDPIKINADFESMQRAQQKMMDNASKAWKTAGISANEYMETAIESSAAMVNSVGGDTEEAARLMDMSITDMSDNVNKMGTTMESLQNAYRGFSRGNFTMLDNLALGFAGTKDGMQELLNKAKELSGVEYDIESYADIVQAIHVIQENMGITGTTAKEAEHTISGSLNAIKAAWDNLVTGFANPDADVGKLVSDVFESAETALDNLLPAVTKALNGVAGFIDRSLPVIIDKVPGLVSKSLPKLLIAIETVSNTIISTISESLPKIVEVAQDILDMLMRSFNRILPQFAPFVSEVMVAIAQFIANNADQFADIAIIIFGAIGDGMIAAAPILLEALPSLIETLATGLASNSGAFLALGSVLVSTLGPIIVSAFSTIWGLVGPAISSQAGPAISTALSSLSTGMSTALASAGTAITGALNSLWAGLVTATNEFFIALTADMGTAFASGGTAALGTAAAAIVGSIVAFFVGAEVGTKIGETLFPSDEQLYAQYEGITGTFDMLKDYFIALKDFYIMIWENISAGAKEFFAAVVDFFVMGWENISKTFNDFIDKALNWGVDLIANFITGIEEQFPNLKGTLTKLAELVKSLIGFSEPTEGPLSNFHTYAPDMMQLFMKGINDNAQALQDTVSSAFDFSNTMSGPSIMHANASNDLYGPSGASGNTSSNRNITVILELDKMEFGRAVYELNNAETQRVGLRLANV